MVTGFFEYNFFEIIMYIKLVSNNFMSNAIKQIKFRSAIKIEPNILEK